MEITDIFQNLIKSNAQMGQRLFQQYNLMSRPILDFFHNFFDILFYIFLFITFFFSLVYLYMSIRVMLSKKKEQKKVINPLKAPEVTVQIPTYNELAAIRCAKKCLDFDYPRDKYTIMIGDDSDNSDISETIQEFADKHDNVQVTRRGHNLGFKPGNLNYMLSKTKGDIIVIFDSDFIPEKDFLKRIVTPFIEHQNISAVQARWKFIDRNKNLTTILGSTIGTLFHFICLPFINTYTKISFLCGSAEAIRKKDLIKLGGWRSGSFTEDIEFSLRLLKNGKKILYLEELECAGEVPHHAKDLYKQQMRWAYGVISSFKDHFTSIAKTTKINFKEKFFIWFFCSGYFLSFLLMLLFLTGTLSFNKCTRPN